MIVARDRHHEASALVEILRDEGIEAMITMCDDAASFVAIEEDPPDLLLVDEDAAPIAGLATLLSRLRERSSNTAIVLMTSWCAQDPTIRPALGRAGCSYLIKPIDVRQLVKLARAATAPRPAGPERSAATA